MVPTSFSEWFKPHNMGKSRQVTRTKKIQCHKSFYLQKKFSFLIEAKSSPHRNIKQHNVAPCRGDIIKDLNGTNINCFFFFFFPSHLHSIWNFNRHKKKLVCLLEEYETRTKIVLIYESTNTKQKFKKRCSCVNSPRLQEEKICVCIMNPKVQKKTKTC